MNTESEKNTQISKTARQSNIELARLVSILGVIFLHYNNRSMGGALEYVTRGTTNFLVMNGFESLFIFAVDLFILISGYFLINSGKRALFKPLTLFIQFVIFKLLFLGVDAALGTEPFSIEGLVKCFLPNDWFINLYIVLFFISPFINIAIRKLSDKHQKLLLILLILFFSVEPSVVDIIGGFLGLNLDHMSFIGLAGSEGGYSIVQFVLMYIIGGVLRQQEKTMVPSSRRMPVLVYLVCASLTLGIGVMTEMAYEYCCPLVMGEAVCVFLIFRDMKIGTSKIINYLAKGCFTVYLVHHHFYKYFDIEHYANGSTPLFALHTIGTAVAIFLICSILHFIYDTCTKAALKKLKNSLAKFEYDIPQ